MHTISDQTGKRFVSTDVVRSRPADVLMGMRPAEWLVAARLADTKPAF
ncbi:hypothetical protein KGQ20_33600 [Catenulispora sp. NF23]|nr:hypothetical protein [Catenulispora pinistramenti]MBS2537699.1 hypothetical protein [Catenulispora pinistramenti]